MSTNVEIVSESSTSLRTSSKDNKYRQLTEYTGRQTGNQELNFTNRAVILSTNDTDSPKLEVRLNLEKSGFIQKNLDLSGKIWIYLEKFNRKNFQNRQFLELKF